MLDFHSRVSSAAIDPRLGTAPRLSRLGSSPRPDQTAMEGPSRHALGPSTTAARRFPGALETLAFPTAAFQNDRLALQGAGPVGQQLGVRAASGQGLLLPNPRSVRMPSRAGGSS